VYKRQGPVPLSLNLTTGADPSLACDARGNAVVTYSRTRTVGSQVVRDQYVQRFSAY
jgi:hypothetical protein